MPGLRHCLKNGGAECKLGLKISAGDNIMANYKLTLNYDGSRYKGWQRLGSGENTLQAKLENVLSRLFDTPVEVIGSGRTDAGVHALGQVANFHVQTRLSAADILTHLRTYLPEDVGVHSVEEVDARFHSRLNAVEKTYRYRIWNSREPCVFERKFVWNIPERLDLSAMEEGALYLTGTHDFMAFCSNKHFKKSSVRTVHSINIQRAGPEIVIDVTGDGFLYNMVRIIAGTLIRVGRGYYEPERVKEILEAKERTEAGVTAPANGLVLVEIKYGE